MKKGLTILAVLVVGLFFATNAMATWISMNQAMEGNSWYDRFGYLPNVSIVDTLEVYMITTDQAFEVPAFRNFAFDNATTTTSDWQDYFNIIPDGTLMTAAQASGTALSLTTDTDPYTSPDTLWYNINFGGNKSTPVLIDLVAWYGSSFVESVGASWNGIDTWTYVYPSTDYSTGQPIDWTSSDSAAFILPKPNPVPEPGTLLLIGSGLIGLAGLRRKFRK